MITGDGSIHNQFGYSDVTKLFHAPDFELGPLSGMPSSHEGELSYARDLISEVFSDVPFAHYSDPAHAIGLLMLPIVRDLVNGDTPGHLITKQFGIR